MMFSQQVKTHSGRYNELESGSYIIEYHDNTHSKENEWSKIIEVELRRSPSSFGDTEAFYQLALNLDGFAPKDAKVVADTISLALLRLGLQSPLLTPETFHQIRSLSVSSGVVLIPDTNSLHNGTLHWLLKALGRTPIWILPFVASLTQIQQKDALLKNLVNKREPKNLAKALRSRAMINAGLGLLERNIGRYQVLELDPSLMRYLRPSGGGTVDPDNSDILEDRLLIEGVHAVLRSTRTRANQLVVTSDVMFSRILSAEGVQNICLPAPILDGKATMPCIRYDPLMQDFTGAPLRALLWDLAHAFGATRLRIQNRSITYSCYWPSKSPVDWRLERLLIEEEGWPEKDIAEVDDSEWDADADAVAATDEAGASTFQAESKAARLESNVSRPDVVNVFSSATLPQASIQQIFKLAGALYALGVATAPEELIEELRPDERPLLGTARRALEILRRTGVAVYVDGTLTATKPLDELNSALAAGELDDLHKRFLAFEPYEVIVRALRRRKTMERKDAEKVLAASLPGPIGKEASARLLKFPIFFGQAWTDDGTIRDGSARPETAYFCKAFASVFDDIARDGIVQVRELLPILCRSLRMSPWAINRAIERSANDGLSNYNFQTGAAGKPLGNDQVVAGSLHDFHLELVPTDRLTLGGRPILTVSERPK